MIVNFKPLLESHFLLLLKWLEMPHVKKFWDRDIIYTIDMIYEKYSSYVKGYKLVGQLEKPIKAFIIYDKENPIGYIQIYNAYDFLENKLLLSFPKDLGAIDVFIGEEEYLNKKLSSLIIKQFLEEYALKQYRYVFARPEFKNEKAVRSYENAGFKIIKSTDKEFLMVANKKIARLSIFDMIALELTFKKYFLENDQLWIFGSRVDFLQKGGDIDLYIETHAKTVDEAFNMKKYFAIEFENKIGEQKIDIVMNMLHHPYHLLIHEVAKTQGVRII